MAFSLDQINSLVNAGYKLEEILAVNGPVDPVENAAPAPAPVEQSNKEILDAINNLTQVIQAGNLRFGGFPAPASPVDAEQVLANIINPPGYTAGKNK